ncbi:hypothetical protein MPER_04859 [Moniliophthora perniciosa FA553]|nr:hypothetical protein MPER_04859 [Moniliophthora perniciosa FA553]
MLGLSTFFFALAVATSASASLVSRDGGDSMKINVSGPTFNVSHGNAGLSASGVLNPFGQIGIGCGVSYDAASSGKDAQYGGGLNAGTPSYGLGGGFAISDKNMTVGFGIGAPKNVSADTNVVITKEGKIDFTFVSTQPITCADTTIGGKKGVKCTIASK